MYCLVVGQVPFHDDNILSLYNKIRTQPFSFPEGRDISPELSDLIHKMLIKDPNERITLPEIKVSIAFFPIWLKVHLGKMFFEFFVAHIASYKTN